MNIPASVPRSFARRILLCLLLSAASCYLLAMSSDQSLPASSTAHPSATPAASQSPEEDVAAYYQKTQSLLGQSRFDQLDALADSARSEKQRFPGGGWKLFAFYDSLENP